MVLLRDAPDRLTSPVVAVVVFFAVYVLADNYLPEVEHATRRQRLTHDYVAGGIAIVAAVLVALLFSAATKWRAERDEARTERDRARCERDTAQTERDSAVAARDAALATKATRLKLDPQVGLIYFATGIAPVCFLAIEHLEGPTGKFVAMLPKSVVGVPDPTYGGIRLAWEWTRDDTREIPAEGHDRVVVGMVVDMSAQGSVPKPNMFAFLLPGTDLYSRPPVFKHGMGFDFTGPIDFTVTVMNMTNDVGTDIRLRVEPDVAGPKLTRLDEPSVEGAAAGYRTDDENPG